MDNNTNNNVSGIPNVSDIKFDDTPAESFDNLYGGGASATQQPVGNMNMNQGPSMVPNPAMSMNQGPMMNQNTSMSAPVSPVAPSVAPAMETPVSPVTPNAAPAMETPVGPVTPNVAPAIETPVSPVTPSVAPVMETPVSPVTPNVAPAMETPVSPVAPSVSQPVEDLSDIDIDDEKMQSIEEQLSKTSQYNPADFQQEQISIPTDNQYEKNKSSLMFLIVIFIILGVTIALAPQIIKFIK